MPPAAAVAVRATAATVSALAAVAVVAATALLLQLLLQLLLLRANFTINYEATLYTVYDVLFSQKNYLSLCIQ